VADEARIRRYNDREAHMRSILAAAVIFGVATLSRVFLMHARAIRRDMNARFEALQDRLEQSANSVVDNLLDRHRVADPDSRGD
jgi:hypothetical protein